MKLRIEETLPTHNQQLQGHWAVRGRQKKRLAQLIANQVGLGPWFVSGGQATNRSSRREPLKAHVRIRLGRPGRHRGHLQDPDNRVASCKPVIDALRKCGWLYDDRGEWMELEVLEVLSKPGFIEIEVRKADGIQGSKGDGPPVRETPGGDHRQDRGD